MARPRSEEARRKALAAAADMISERGVASLSIEEVAARSGVAKTTIYRHWPERGSLIIDTVRSTFEHVGTPDTGSLRADLQTFFEGLMRADLSGRTAKVMPCLVDAAARDPEIALLADRLGVERSQPVLQIVARAQARGELPDELDPAIVITAIVGPIVFRKLVQRQVVDAAFIAASLHVAIAGLRALPADAAAVAAVPVATLPVPEHHRRAGHDAGRA